MSYKKMFLNFCVYSIFFSAQGLCSTLVEKEGLLVQLHLREEISKKITDKSVFQTKIIFFHESKTQNIEVYKVIFARSFLENKTLKTKINLAELKSVNSKCLNCEVVLKVEFCTEECDSNSNIYFAKRRFKSIQDLLKISKSPIDLFLGRKISQRFYNTDVGFCSIVADIEISKALNLKSDLHKLYFFYINSEDFWIYRGRWRVNFDQLVKANMAVESDVRENIKIKINYSPFKRRDSLNFEEDNHIGAIKCDKKMSFQFCLENLKNKKNLERHFFILDAKDYSGISCQVNKKDFLLYPKIDLYSYQFEGMPELMKYR